MKYEEDYVGALDCFSRAQALDPTWNEPKEKEASLVRIYSIETVILCRYEK
jgi:hypothetical protein